MQQIQAAAHDLTNAAASLDIPVQLRLVTDGPEISAYLAPVDGGFLKLSASVPLANDLSVEVVIDGCTIRAEVVSCEQRSPGSFMIPVRRVVRNRITGLGKEGAAPAVNRTYGTARRSRRKGRFAFVKKALCTIAGHEYGWSIDLWDRAILGCARCGEVLSP